MQKLQLVSFKLCPFVQRSVIVLREKNVPFDITYIELEHPPEWFAAISPFGKVPLLCVGDEVLFESAVIMEYLDEVFPPSLHPEDPLRKAQNRAWFEFASSLLFGQYRLGMAKEEGEFTAHATQLRSDLVRLDAQVHGPYFNGPEFNLVDAAFAPFFLRERLLDSWHRLGLLAGLDKLQVWQEALLERPAVRYSVVEDFAERLRAHLAHGGGFAAGRFG
jgi:glutathione S-transferase